jgi:hypothetical protein
MAKQYMFDFSHFFCNHPVHTHIYIYIYIYIYKGVQTGSSVAKSPKDSYDLKSGVLPMVVVVVLVVLVCDSMLFIRLLPI